MLKVQIFDPCYKCLVKTMCRNACQKYIKYKSYKQVTTLILCFMLILGSTVIVPELMLQVSNKFYKMLIGYIGAITTAYIIYKIFMRKGKYE